MSAQDVAQISECLRNIAMREQLRRERFWRRPGGQQTIHVLDLRLPGALLYRILAFCDPPSLRAALVASR